MANLRSKKVIDRGLKQYQLELAKYGGRAKLPAAEHLYDMIEDYEDVIYCRDCSIKWDWKKGRTTVEYEYSNGYLILTRHRVLLVGVKDRSVELEIAIWLDDVEFFPAWGLRPLTVKRKLEYEPPNPPTEKTGWRAYQKDPRPSLLFDLTIGDRDGLTKQLKILPYSFGTNGLGDLDLPIVPEMEELNRLVTGNVALHTIADWIISGELSFPVQRITNRINESGRLLFTAKVKINGTPWANSTVLLLITEKKLIFLNDEGDKVHSNINLEDIDLVSFEHSLISRMFHRTETALVTSEGRFTVRFVDDEEYKRTKQFLSALQFAGLGGRLRYDNDELLLGEFDALQPFERIKEDASYESSKEEHPETGYVYILMNPQYAPDLLKIGKTTRMPNERAQEIFSTGVPGEFIVAFDEKVKDCTAAEAEIHSRLAEYRVSDNREFFRIPLKDAVRAVSEVAMKVGVVDD